MRLRLAASVLLLAALVALATRGPPSEDGERAVELGAVAGAAVAHGRVDFESGTFAAIVAEQESSPDRITAVTSVAGGPPLRGRYSARVATGPQDFGVAGASGYRSELYVWRFRDLVGGASLEGKQLWVAWDMLVDPSFPTPARWATLAQFHAGIGPPVLGLTVDPRDRLVFEVRGGPLVDGRAASYRGFVLQPRLVRGRRIAVKIWIHWSTGGAGRTKVWLNGNLRHDVRGPNLVVGYESAPYMKLGVYRSDAPTESVAYFDDIRWATAARGLRRPTRP